MSTEHTNNSMACKGEVEVPASFTGAEKVPAKVFDQPEDASFYVAELISAEILKHQELSRPCVLGLATGSTPQKVYKYLIDIHKTRGVSWKNVVTFNLDEYMPMQPDCLQSYNLFMNEHLFKHVDIPKENINIPDGNLKSGEIAVFCENYEKKIESYGGIDIQLLGIGRTGHIGFNEPGSTMNSATRLVQLDAKTITDAASDFFGRENVPREAITMGVGTIMKAKKCILLAFNENKGAISKRAIEGEVSVECTASFLQKHSNFLYVLDSAAAASLTRVECPWVLPGASADIDWDFDVINRAVEWLSLKLKKPIRSLSEHDYQEHGLDRLLKDSSVDILNEKIFQYYNGLVTDFPIEPKGTNPVGGRGLLDPQDRKRVVVFSPHPDDDVISMGHTLTRLCDQGHEVYCVYETSGNIAVWDHEVDRLAFVVTEYLKMNKLPGAQEAQALHLDLEKQLKSKKPGQVDSRASQLIKGLIRKGEARSAAMYCGVHKDRIKFLDLPFYETGKVVKKPLGEDDIDIVQSLLDEIKPDYIFAAGDLSDPHGTHRVALQAVEGALKYLLNRDGKASWVEEMTLYLYRGAWLEWPPHCASFILGMTQNDVDKKREAIFRHQSQKDHALFPGNDPREFWQRAEARNKDTAGLLTQLGLPNMEGAEVFVRSTDYKNASR